MGMDAGAQRPNSQDDQSCSCGHADPKPRTFTSGRDQGSENGKRRKENSYRSSKLLRQWLLAQRFNLLAREGRHENRPLRCHPLLPQASAEGREIADGFVTCPWDGSTFRLNEESIVRGPATQPQRAFETRSNNGQIEVGRRRA